MCFTLTYFPSCLAWEFPATLVSVSIFRSCFRLTNPEDDSNDEYLLNEGLPDKRLYEALRHPVNELKRITSERAGVDLIAELGKRYAAKSLK